MQSEIMQFLFYFCIFMSLFFKNEMDSNQQLCLNSIRATFASFISRKYLFEHNKSNAVNWPGDAALSF